MKCRTNKPGSDQRGKRNTVDLKNYEMQLNMKEQDEEEEENNSQMDMKLNAYEEKKFGGYEGKGEESG